MIVEQEIPPLPPQALEAFRERHVIGKGRSRYCQVCKTYAWPCPMARLISMLDTERRRGTRLVSRVESLADFIGDSPECAPFGERLESIALDFYGEPDA